MSLFDVISGSSFYIEIGEIEFDDDNGALISSNGSILSFEESINI